MAKEPCAKVLEWFNSPVSMEKVYRFPLLRLKLSDAPPPLRHPRESGDTEEGEQENI
jgi:hypothetical protein